MAILEIRKNFDAVLRRRADEVSQVTDATRTLIRDMIDTMHAAQGVGLAAPQVGVSSRILIANDTGEPGNDIALINPRIVSRGGKVAGVEGCLSLPGLWAEVRRSAQVTVEALTPEGKEVRLEGRELLSRIFQHEIDHLDGILFIDRIGYFERRRLLRTLQAQDKEIAVL